MADWIRVPAEIGSEDDRRTITGILTSIGLEARVVRVRLTKSGSVRKFVEFREQEREAEL